MTDSAVRYIQALEDLTELLERQVPGMRATSRAGTWTSSFRTMCPPLGGQPHCS